MFVNALIGIAVIWLWVGGLMLAFFTLVHKFGLLRSPPEEEEAGMDISKHGGSACARHILFARATYSARAYCPLTRMPPRPATRVPRRPRPHCLVCRQGVGGLQDYCQSTLGSELCCEEAWDAWRRSSAHRNKRCPEPPLCAPWQTSSDVRSSEDSDLPTAQPTQSRSGFCDCHQRSQGCARTSLDAAQCLRAPPAAPAWPCQPGDDSVMMHLTRHQVIAHAQQVPIAESLRCDQYWYTVITSH
jgi:hypothetical protein